MHYINYLFIIIFAGMVMPSHASTEGQTQRALNELAQKSWFSGAQNCELDNHKAIEVHQLTADTYILRQNKCTHYEAPFIYLLFGHQKALLIDTGATKEADKFPLAKTVASIMQKRRDSQLPPTTQLSLIVAHSHSHGDHIAADGQFVNNSLINSQVIKAKDTHALSQAFAISNWPTRNGAIDLGGREIIVIPTPGHQAQAVTFYDRKTQIMFTGDSIYPGRLYVRKWHEFKQSMQRLVNFSEQYPVSALLGAHIEMSKQVGIDYPVGATYQPNEHSLLLTVRDLEKLHRELAQLPSAKRVNLGNMIIYPVD